MATDNKKQENTGNEENGMKVGRRDMLKGLATVPVVGALAYGVLRKTRLDRIKSENSIPAQLGLNTDPIVGLPLTDPQSKTINIGLIGYGIRGKQLAQALGFAHPTMVDEMIEAESKWLPQFESKTFVTAGAEEIRSAVGAP